MNIQSIRESRSHTIAQMRALTELATKESRDLTDDEDQRFNRFKGELQKLEKQLERAEVVAEAERSMIAAETPRKGFDGSFSQACRAFSVTRAIAAQLDPGNVDAGREHEVSRELALRSGRTPTGILVPHDVFLERRAVTTSGTGGNLVPDVHRPDLFIDKFRAGLRIQGLGATVLSDLVGDQTIPRLTDSATPYWVAEHADVTGSDQTFDSINLQPKTVGAEVEYSRRMIINASPAVENLVRNDLAKVIAQGIEDAAINADGTGNRPLGLMNLVGVGTVDFGDPDGAVPTWEKVLEIIATVQDADALHATGIYPGGEGDRDAPVGWLTNPQAVKKMRSVVISQGSGDEIGWLMLSPDELAGYKLRQTTLVPKNLTKGTGTDLSPLIFGVWSEMLIGYWGGVDVLVNPFHADVYSKGGIKINAMQDCDVSVRHPESFCIAKDMVTS